MAHFFSLLFNNSTVLVYPSIFLFFVVLIALVFWKKKLSKVLLSIGVIYFYFSANGMIPMTLMFHLEKPFTTVNDRTIISNRAMIVLGGGISYYPSDISSLFTSDARILEAYRIYNVAQVHHVQYTIFLSGGYTNKSKSISEAALYKRELLQLGVPNQYLITEDKSLNTYQNAEYLKPILQGYPFKEYVLVSGALHMKRAQEYFDHFNIRTIPAPSDFPYPIIKWLPIEYNLSMQAIALHEYIGILRFKVYNYLHIN